MENKEWYTMDELAEMWGVAVSRVQNFVRVLSRAGTIQVRNKPSDMKYKEVNRNSLEVLRRAVLGE